MSYSTNFSPLHCDARDTFLKNVIMPSLNHSLKILKDLDDVTRLLIQDDAKDYNDFITLLKTSKWKHPECETTYSSFIDSFRKQVKKDNGRSYKTQLKEVQALKTEIDPNNGINKLVFHFAHIQHSSITMLMMIMLSHEPDCKSCGVPKDYFTHARRLKRKVLTRIGDEIATKVYGKDLKQAKKNNDRSKTKTKSEPSRDDGKIGDNPEEENEEEDEDDDDNAPSKMKRKRKLGHTNVDIDSDKESTSDNEGNGDDLDAIYSKPAKNSQLANHKMPEDRVIIARDQVLLETLLESTEGNSPENCCVSTPLTDLTYIGTRI